MNTLNYEEALHKLASRQNFTLPPLFLEESWESWQGSQELLGFLGFLMIYNQDS